MNKIKKNGYVHLIVDGPDNCGSFRIKCTCGTHFNTTPRDLISTLKWVDRHNKCYQ